MLFSSVLFSSLLGATLALDGLNNDDMFKQETNCPVYKCPEGQVAVQKAFTTKKEWPVVYGCEASAFNMLTMMDPSNLNAMMGQKGGNREKLWKCCVNRDVSQQVCGLTKKKLEDDYSTCSDKKCRGDKNCKMQSGFGLIMGSVGGTDKCQEYNDFQANACECVAEAEKDDYFKKAIGEFYKVFAKEKLPEKDVDDDWLSNSVYKKFKKGQETEIWHALFQKYSSKLQHKERPKPDYSKDRRADSAKESSKGSKKEPEQEEETAANAGVEETVEL